VLALALSAAALAGCGHAPRPGALRLERTDLVLFARALRALEGPVGNEVAAARGAWPALVHGLPHPPTPALRRAVARADARAGALALPALVISEGGLTGPSADIAGLLKDYFGLSRRGWRFIAAALDEAGAGTSFLRANAGLYIYCVYDGHFELSTLGEKLQGAYRKLGGSAAFGGALSAAEIRALMHTYSARGARLLPHPAPGVHV
jgi:hypothetical protein